jgi:hypothetical protein
MKKSNPEIVGKCLLCQQTQVLTAGQIADAQANGSATSTCCMFPMTVESVKAEPKLSYCDGKLEYECEAEDSTEREPISIYKCNKCGYERFDGHASVYNSYTDKK